eukprot:356388-Chlamydomonas_euryale.AAC.4
MVRAADVAAVAVVAVVWRWCGGGVAVVWWWWQCKQWWHGSWGIIISRAGKAAYSAGSVLNRQRTQQRSIPDSEAGEAAYSPGETAQEKMCMGAFRGCGSLANPWT